MPWKIKKRECSTILPLEKRKKGADVSDLSYAGKKDVKGEKKHAARSSGRKSGRVESLVHLSCVKEQRGLYLPSPRCNL